MQLGTNKREALSMYGMEAQTNNAVESFNRMNLGRNKSNFFDFIGACF